MCVLIYLFSKVNVSNDKCYNNVTLELIYLCATLVGNHEKLIVHR